MKRKFISGILATALALATMSTCTFADMTINGSTVTDASTVVTGGGTVISAEEIYDVILPTNLSYALDVDSYLKDAQNEVTNVSGSAIYSGQFGVVNHSSTALQINARLQLDIATDSSVVVTDKAVITANNAKTQKSQISTTPLLNLELVPVSKSGITVAPVKVGNATYAAISGIVEADIATEASMVLSSDASTMIFALSQAAYEVSTKGVSLETTNGGFVVSGDASEICKVYDSSKTAYVDDPVVAFTITGDVNKYANWKNVELPEITAIFTLTPLTKLDWDAITFNPKAPTVVSDGAIAATAYYFDDGNAAYISLVPIVNGNAISDPGFEDINDVTNVKINGKTATASIVENYLCLPYDQFDGVEAPFTITFTANGVDYSVYAAE